MTPPLQERDSSTQYEFRVRGRLDTRWAGWFEGLTLTHDGVTTTLRGAIVDQAALHGVLSKFRDLGLTLISMRTLDDPEAPQPTNTAHDTGPPRTDPA